MLRVRLRIRRIDHQREHEALSIVNSGFIGREPEILVPAALERELELDSVSTPGICRRILADGSEVNLKIYGNSAAVSVVTEDYETSSVQVSVLTSGKARHVLMNDKLTGKLGIVILDLGEGLWCFRHELGMKVRRTL